MYDVSRIIKNIRHNSKFYLLLLLELVLCFTMMIIGLDEKASYNERVSVLNYENELGLCSVSDTKGGMLFDFDSDKFTLDKIPANTVYGTVYYLRYITAQHKPKSARLISANDYFYEKYFGEALSSDKCYISRKFIKSAGSDSNKKEIDKGISEKGFQLSANQFTISGMNMKVLELDKDIRIPVNMFERFDLSGDEDIIFVNDKISNKLSLDRAFTFIKIHKDSDFQKNIEAFQPYQKDIMHHENLLTEFELGSNKLAAFVRLFGWTSYIAIIVVTLGTTGVFIVFLEQRKKSYAIQYCFGASNFRLKLQLFFEILLIMLLSVFISVIVSALFEKSVSSAYYLIKIQATSIAAASLLAIVLTFIILLLSGNKISTKNIQRWIR